MKRVFALLFVLFCVPAPARALDLDGVALGMTMDQVRAAPGAVDKQSLELTALTGPDGETRGWLAKTKQGFPHGGFFQVAFDTNKQAYAVTLNRRLKHGQSEDRSVARLDAALNNLVRAHGLYDKLCVRRFDGAVEYRAWWGEAPEDCSLRARPLPAPHLHANLVQGSWTEIFVTLTDPERLFRK